MPFAIYNYVYYEPLTPNGPVTRQNRNPGTSSKYVPIPGITVPPTNDLASGSNFIPDMPPPSYTIGNNTYNFGFMNVSGCVGAGQTSTDYNHLPGYPPSAQLLVGNEVINILVVYIAHGGGGGNQPPPPPGIYLDAFNETTGAFLDNFFVTGISPNNSLTGNVNVYGSLARVPSNETLTASHNPLNTPPPVPNSSAVFDKWVKLEGPAGNPVISGNSPVMVVDGSTPSDITAFAFYKDQAATYITGSYHSPDIILSSPFSASSIGAIQYIGNADNNLVPGVPYGFAAVVHNDSAYEVSTKVTFWHMPGGATTLGTLLDTQTVIVEPASSKTVFSSVPFVNAGGHACAAVNLDTADSPCQFNPTTSAQSVGIPDPTINVARSCSAWRNTDATYIFPHQPWHFGISLGELYGEYEGAAIGIQFKTQHVPAGFLADEKVMEEVRLHKAIYGRSPAYLIPSLMERLPSVDLKSVLTLSSNGKISGQREGNEYIVHFSGLKETAFKVSGVVPENAKPGDTYLVQVTANYPKTKRLQPKSVQFLQVFIVREK